VLVTFGVILVGLSFLVFYGWRDKPIFLRLASTILIPLAGLYFVYGFPFEFRVFYEAYPIIVALGLGSFLRLLPQKYRTVLIPSP
jgi:hypothetical protein